ncbi:MAG: acylphosphatase [Candidatus Riflebacteria bacterium]|nr:acylphosphatase [Candidatus Riflebacteria bacterium]
MDEPRTDVPEERCEEFIVTGTVQGVGYRYFAQRVAVRLGVRGFVRNLPDGSVQVVAQAGPAVLDELAGLLREGPRFSEVEAVSRREFAGGRFAGFDIRI